MLTEHEQVHKGRKEDGKLTPGQEQAPLSECKLSCDCEPTPSFHRGSSNKSTNSCSTFTCDSTAPHTPSFSGQGVVFNVLGSTGSYEPQLAGGTEVGCYSPSSSPLSEGEKKQKPGEKQEEEEPDTTAVAATAAQGAPCRFSHASSSTVEQQQGAHKSTYTAKWEHGLTQAGAFLLSGLKGTFGELRQAIYCTEHRTSPKAGCSDSQEAALAGTPNDGLVEEQQPQLEQQQQLEQHVVPPPDLVPAPSTLRTKRLQSRMGSNSATSPAPKLALSLQVEEYTGLGDVALLPPPGSKLNSTSAIRHLTHRLDSGEQQQAFGSDFVCAAGTDQDATSAALSAPPASNTSPAAAAAALLPAPAAAAALDRSCVPSQSAVLNDSFMLPVLTGMCYQQQTHSEAAAPTSSAAAAANAAAEAVLLEGPPKASSLAVQPTSATRLGDKCSHTDDNDWLGEGRLAAASMWRAFPLWGAHTPTTAASTPATPDWKQGMPALLQPRLAGLGRDTSSCGMAHHAPELLHHQLQQLCIRQQQGQPHVFELEDNSSCDGVLGSWSTAHNGGSLSSPVPPVRPIDSIWSMPDLFPRSYSTRTSHGGAHEAAPGTGGSEQAPSSSERNSKDWLHAPLSPLQCVPASHTADSCRMGNGGRIPFVQAPLLWQTATARHPHSAQNPVGSGLGHQQSFGLKPGAAAATPERRYSSSHLGTNRHLKNLMAGMDGQPHQHAGAGPREAAQPPTGPQCPLPSALLQCIQQLDSYRHAPPTASNTLSASTSAADVTASTATVVQDEVMAAAQVLLEAMNPALLPQQAQQRGVLISSSGLEASLRALCSSLQADPGNRGHGFKGEATVAGFDPAPSSLAPGSKEAQLPELLQAIQRAVDLLQRYSTSSLNHGTGAADSNCVGDGAGGGAVGEGGRTGTVACGGLGAADVASSTGMPAASDQGGGAPADVQALLVAAQAGERSHVSQLLAGRTSQPQQGPAAGLLGDSFELDSPSLAHLVGLGELGGAWADDGRLQAQLGELKAQIWQQQQQQQRIHQTSLLPSPRPQHRSRIVNDRPLPHLNLAYTQQQLASPHSHTHTHALPSPHAHPTHRLSSRHHRLSVDTASSPRYYLHNPQPSNLKGGFSVAVHADAALSSPRRQQPRGRDTGFMDPASSYPPHGRLLSAEATAAAAAADALHSPHSPNSSLPSPSSTSSRIRYLPLHVHMDDAQDFAAGQSRFADSKQQHAASAGSSSSATPSNTIPIGSHPHQALAAGWAAEALNSSAGMSNGPTPKPQRSSPLSPGGMHATVSAAAASTPSQPPPPAPAPLHVLPVCGRSSLPIMQGLGSCFSAAPAPLADLPTTPTCSCGANAKVFSAHTTPPSPTPYPPAALQLPTQLEPLSDPKHTTTSTAPPPRSVPLLHHHLRHHTQQQQQQAEIALAGMAGTSTLSSPAVGLGHNGTSDLFPSYLQGPPSPHMYPAAHSTHPHAVPEYYLTASGHLHQLLPLHHPHHPNNLAAALNKPPSSLNSPSSLLRGMSHPAPKVNSPKPQPPLNPSHSHPLAAAPHMFYPHHGPHSNHHPLMMPNLRQGCLPFEKPVTVGVVSVRHAGAAPPQPQPQQAAAAEPGVQSSSAKKEGSGLRGAKSE